MPAWRPCPDHDWMKEELMKLRNNKKFWHRLLDSKWFFWIITGIVILCLSFIGWIGREIYAQKANEKENKKVIETVCSQTKEIKDDIKDIKTEIANDKKERAEQRLQDQKELMKVLLEIKKEVKK